MVSRASLSPFFWAQKVLINLQKAGAISRGYPIKIDDIVLATREISGIAQIEFRFAPFDSELIRGAFIRFERPTTTGAESVVQILVSSTLDKSWRRLVACKEISQIFFSDVAGYTNSSEEDEVIAYFDGLLNQHSLPAFSPAIQTDQLAMICAVEILCPFIEREKVLDQVINGSIGRNSIAQKFEIPEPMVGAIFNRTYHENARLSLMADSNADFLLNPRARNLTSDLEYMFRKNVREALKENEGLKRGIKKLPANE